MQEPVLCVHAVTKAFGSNIAVDDISARLFPGRVLVLAGENGSGKSTLLKMMAGLLAPDAGTIELAGESVPPGDRRAHRDAGIELIAQEGSLVPELSVAENISLGRRIGSSSWRPDRTATRNVAAEALRHLELDIDPDLPAARLSRSDQQLVEVARGLASDARILLLDEPTSSLGPDQADSLINAARRFADLGGAAAFVSHRMPEVYQIGDDVVVLRDGCLVHEGPLDELDEEDLVDLMVGRHIESYDRSGQDNSGTQTCLEVQGLVDRTGRVGPIDIEVRAGEVVGLAGLVGAGRTETLEMIASVRARRSGSVRVCETAIHGSPRSAINHGITLVTEDRRRSGIIPDFDVLDNLSLAQSDRSWTSPKSARRRVGRWIDELGIRTTSGSASIMSLSGGNQQKVLIGRAVSCAPTVLLLDEPTRGVDVGAKAEIHDLIRRLASEGVAVLVASSELPEIIALSHRIVVMKEGRIAGELAPGSTERQILALATGVGAAA